MQSDTDNESYAATNAKLRKISMNINASACSSEESAAGGAKPAKTEFNAENPQADTFSSPWMGQYAIVKAILQLLPLKDLLSASSVCQFWSQVGKFVREKRRNLPTTILWHPYYEQGRTREAVEYFNDVQISDEVNQFMDNADPSFIDVLASDLSDEQYKEWETCFRRDFDQQFSVAQMIVLFATKSFADYIQTRKNRFSSKKTAQHALFGSSIPKTVPCVCAFGCGLAFTMPPPNSGIVYEMERTELPMITGLLIPKAAGLRTRVVSFDKAVANLYKRRNSVTSENCKEILGISSAENVKGFIFLDANSGPYTTPFMDAAFHYVKDNPTVCFAGGNVFFTQTSLRDEEMSKQLGFGVLICDDDDSTVKVGTVGLFEPGITPENEEKLKKFQALLEEDARAQSFAFMFACNGRGAYMHEKEHVEVSLFRKFYPNTPIVGIFTNGELAHEYLHGDEPPPPPKNRGSLEYTFSTIFMFVSYKHEHA